MRRIIGTAAIAGLLFGAGISQAAPALTLKDDNTFEMQGLSVLVHQNAFHPVFRDEKIAGIEIILHGERLATNGEVRLMPTPEQWDAVPELAARKRGAVPNQMIVTSEYPDQHFSYRLEVTAEGQGFRVAVILDKPLPEALAGKAGFNMDFVPSRYFGKSYILDTASGIFPRIPGGPMAAGKDGTLEPQPFATGKSLVLSPEDPLTRIAIASDGAPLMLYDARNKAQNGWYVVRSLLPAGRTGRVLTWHIRPHVIPGWVRQPVVSFNQAGYTPGRSKVAVIELDAHSHALPVARVLHLNTNGQYSEVFRGKVAPWGKWLRYNYAKFDFSAVRKPGIYAIAYGHTITNPFRIAKDVYADVWHASLDTYLPVQMDHIAVRENYRIWHGVSHMDDARQAPPNHKHFDGYAMGPNLDSPYAAGEHIPGLAIGGWYDAGDFDIRTQSQTFVVRDLVAAIEMFGVDRDDTTVDEAARQVEIRKPDGVPDAVQQVKHGVLQLLAQYKAVGHAIPGIIAPTLQQYTHLGDGASKTDGKIYDPKMGPNDSDGIHSGRPDDRWAFTTHTTPLNYDSAAALAAASRVLKDSDKALAKECLETAERVWEEEHKGPPVVAQSFNTAGGDLNDNEFIAAVELLLATGEDRYKARVKELLPALGERFAFVGWQAIRAVPQIDAAYRAEVEALLKENLKKLDGLIGQNPFGVPIITTGTWGGAHFAVAFASQMYMAHKIFPELVGTQHILDGFDYVLGRHPASNISYVSGVGTNTRLIAYGNNRADFSFIPGGMIPGIRVVQPDYPELKSDWPFLWYENEYVIGTVTAFILAANAAEAVSK